ncbi:hypothetical protein [Streptomyces sp. NPDC059378]|uniref:hypothetical protein n=1 Tax=Streptomyces sp. NPDC059378 TaxID=3346815 RepID=UPI003687D7D5
MLVDPTTLLDDCERAWRAWGQPPSLEVLALEDHRMSLVLDALVAYQLVARCSELPTETVARTWPACVAGAVAHAHRNGVDPLIGRLWGAHQRAVGENSGTPSDTTAYVTIAAEWWGRAQEAARSLSWPWPLPKTAHGNPQSALMAGILQKPASNGQLAIDPEPAAQSPVTLDERITPPPPTRRRAIRPTGPVTQAVTPLPAPELRLATGGSGVLLSLAAGAEADGSEEWKITADSEPVVARSPYWALHRPVRRIEATCPRQVTHTLNVVDPATALLAFTADGQHIAPGEPLPADETYLLHAGELDTDGTAVGVVELPTPYGWSGWTLSRLSLAKVRRLRTAGAASDQWLEVAAGGPLRWEGGSRLRWITHTDDAPVWNEPPSVRLPHRPGTAPARWRIRVVRPGTETTFAQLDGVSGAVVDPWREVPRPLSGPYEVIATRASAQNRTNGGRRLAAFLAEGVTASTSAEWRLLAPGGGLAPAEVTIKGHGPVTVSAGRVVLASHESERTLVLRNGQSKFTVRAFVPHSEVRLETDGHPQPWSLRPLDIDAAELERGCALTVRLPEQAVAATPVLALVVDGTELHTAQPERRIRTRKGDLRYSLTPFTDTMRDCKRAELRLTVAGERLLVATLRSQPLAEGVEADGVGLRLRGLRHPGSLTAHVHAAFAPWVPPLAVSVARDGSIALPASWRQAGPMVVRLTVPGAQTNGMAAANWPDLRDRDTHVLRRAPGIPGFVSGAEATVATYLAGRGTLPSSPEMMPYQWQIAAHGTDLQSCGARESVLRDCFYALGADPMEALLRSAGANLRSGDLAPVIIRSGLAVHRIRSVDDPDAVRSVWRTAPLSALLLTGPLLPYLADSADYAIEELYPEERVLLDEAREFLGAEALTLLKGNGDPHPAIGRFGVEARALASMPDVRQRAVWRQVNSVPQALLHADTRTAASWQAFHARRNLQYRVQNARVPDRINSLGAFLERQHPTLHAAFRHRATNAYHSAEDTWMHVPQLSLGFALVTRLAAWGNERAAELESEFRLVWSNIVAQAPDLAAVDLALAECLVAAAHTHRSN